MGTAAPELPPLAPAPVLLDVSSTVAVVAAGTAFTVAVSVSPSRADTPLPAGLTVHVQLPAGAAAHDVAGSPLDWVLPLLAPGTAHTQTVQLVADGSTPLLGIEAAVSGAGVLPVMQTQWFVVAPADAAAIDAAEPQAASPSGVNDLPGATATLGEQGAVVQSPAGGVTLALANDAAPVGAVVHYTPRFDWRSAPPAPPAADASPTPAPTVSEGPEAPEDMGTRVFLPGVFGGSTETPRGTYTEALDALAPGGTGDPQASNPDVPRVQEGGITFYAQWELGAEVAPTGDAAAAAGAPSAAARTDSEVAQLQAEALLVVDVADLSAAGVNPRRLQVWTREETGEPWTPLHALYDDDAHVLRAWLPHFSQFGLGEGLTPSGDQLPSVQAFTADILSGGASASVPFETPAGLGGLKPNLGLSYSSVTMDDLYLAGGDNAMTAQAGAAGFGWNLGGLSYIVRTDGKGDDDTRDGDKTFALVLNGERMAVTFVDTHWHTNPEIFAQISWAGSVLSETRDYAGWTVTTVDGVRYDFGDAFAYDGYRQDSATAYALANTNGGESFRQGRRWYLRQVTDPRGNSMEYHYKTERAYKTCQVESNWVSNGWNWYTSSVDPLEITWSGNPSQGADYKLRAIFVYSTTARTDTQVENWAPGSCNAAYAAQPLVGLWNKLSGLSVQVKDTGGYWQQLRSYDLVQGTQTFNAPTAKQRPYLISVSARGQSGGLLRKYSFTYAFSNLNQVWLTKADNGWGGSVTYSR